MLLPSASLDEEDQGIVGVFGVKKVHALVLTQEGL
jgi:hypothetical protein